MPAPTPRTISEFCCLAQSWAENYYRCEGTPTGEAQNIKDALKPLAELAGYESPDSITADLLYDCRQVMLDSGLSRTTINSRLKRIKRVMRWAAQPPRRWITAAQVADIDLTDSLKRWRTDAPESPGVAAVEWAQVEATINQAEPWLVVALHLHWWTGMRPAEVVNMRRSELAERDDCMVYSPRLHKTAYMGKTRNVVIGPRGCEILRAWLLVSRGDRLFPVHSEQGYYQAIRRAAAKAGVPHWSPNQVRHSYLTRVGNIDLDGARAQAGHTTTRTTEVYVHRDLSQAIEVQRIHG